MATGGGFADVEVPVRFKLFGLWTSLVFCYLYGDYFELYQPGKLPGMLSGTTVFGPVREGVLLGMAGLMVAPCLMGVLSLLLPVGLSRWLNIVFGALYTLVMIAAVRGAWEYYLLFGVIEIVLTGSIVWYAWRWPRADGTSPGDR